jgi:hypothetical protein
MDKIVLTNKREEIRDPTHVKGMAGSKYEKSLVQQ